MQPNEITLAVDELNNATTVDHVYTRFEEHLNRSVYIGEDHSLDSRDTLNLYRTLPKPSGNFKGVGKSAIKTSKDTVVAAVDATSLVSPIIFETTCSIPVGATLAEVLVERQKHVAALDRDDIMVGLNSQLMI